MSATLQVPVQVFAANNSSYRGRKRAHRACDQCKKRRVRSLAFHSIFYFRLHVPGPRWGWVGKESRHYDTAYDPDNDY